MKKTIIRCTLMICAVMCALAYLVADYITSHSLYFEEWLNVIPFAVIFIYNLVKAIKESDD